jgi:hypothetical protein
MLQIEPLSTTWRCFRLSGISSSLTNWVLGKRGTSGIMTGKRPAVMDINSGRYWSYVVSVANRVPFSSSKLKSSTLTYTFRIIFLLLVGLANTFYSRDSHVRKVDCGKSGLMRSRGGRMLGNWGFGGDMMNPWAKAGIRSAERRASRCHLLRMESLAAINVSTSMSSLRTAKDVPSSSSKSKSRTSSPSIITYRDRKSRQLFDLKLHGGPRRVGNPQMR